jgi:hypothetical protein
LRPGGHSVRRMVLVFSIPKPARLGPCYGAYHGAGEAEGGVMRVPSRSATTALPSRVEDRGTVDLDRALSVMRPPYDTSGGHAFIHTEPPPHPVR